MQLLTRQPLKYLVPAVLALLLLGLLGWQLYLYLLPAEEKLLRDESVQRGLVYCEQGPDTMQLDFYPADSEVGLVIYLHAGGWRQGDRKLRPNTAELVMQLRKNGLNVASIDYRLTPKHKLPDMLDDINCALDYLGRRGHELGYNPKRVGILGAGAGGHLGLLAAGQRKASGLSPVQAVVALFAPTNLTNGTQLWLAQPDNYHTQLMLELVGSMEQEQLQQASPLFYAEYLDAPSLLVYGDRDQMVGPGQGMDLYWRLRLLGKPGKFLLVKDSGHITPLSDKTSPDRQQLNLKISKFLSQHLNHCSASRC